MIETQEQPAAPSKHRGLIATIVLLVFLAICIVLFVLLMVWCQTGKGCCLCPCFCMCVPTFDPVKYATHAETTLQNLEPGTYLQQGTPVPYPPVAKLASKLIASIRKKRDSSLAESDYEQYYEDGEYDEEGKPKPRKKTPKEKADSIDWHIQLLLIFAMIIIILLWLWLYCCFFPIIECCGYFKDKKNKVDPRYRVVKRVAKTLKQVAPTYDEFTILIKPFESRSRSKTFDPEKFLRFAEKQKQKDIP